MKKEILIREVLLISPQEGSRGMSKRDGYGSGWAGGGWRRLESETKQGWVSNRTALDQMSFGVMMA